jgi:CTP-dependent riboflavin kinase
MVPDPREIPDDQASRANIVEVSQQLHVLETELNQLFDDGTLEARQVRKGKLIEIANKKRELAELEIKREMKLLDALKDA